MNISESSISAKVDTVFFDEKSGNPTYYLTVSFNDIGMHLKGWTGRHSPKFPEQGWWIQVPKGGKSPWPPRIEWREPKTNKLRLHLDEICRRAIDTYLSAEEAKAKQTNGETIIPSNAILPSEINFDEIFDQAGRG